MTSEIRVNKLQNRVGLGTIEYSNTGPVISGVTTSNNFKTGTSNLHSTGLNVQDLDVEGHTNLDNVSVAGIVTITSTGDYQGPLINGNICPTVRFATNNNTTPLWKAGLSGNTADTFAISDGATSNDRLTVNATKTTINGYLNTGSIELDTRIYHTGDTNNKIEFGTDIQYFYTNGSERIKIENSGVVITGVTTFSASAHVSNASGSVFFGAGNATSYGNQGGIGRAGGSNYHIGSSAVGDLCIAAEGSKRILFGTKTGTGIGGITKRMSIASSGTVTIDGNLDAVGGIDATANSTFAGDIDVDGHTNLDNVNITGITTSSNKFQVNGLGIGIQPIDHHHIHIESANPRILIRSTGTNAAKILFGDNSSNDAGVIEYAHSSNNMMFNTGNVERLRIDSAGTIGYRTGGGKGFSFNSSGSSADAANVFCPASYTIAFGTNSNERLRIDSNGNVMIGRTAAQKKFSVRETSNSSGVYYNAHIGGASHLVNYAIGIGFDPEGYEARTKMALVAEGTSQGYSRGKFHFLLDAANDSGEASLSESRMTITDAGRVGINETSPDGNLHIKSSNPAIYLEDSTGSSQHGQAIIEQNGDNLKIRQDAGNASSGTASNISLQVDAFERLKIASSGALTNTTNSSHSQGAGTFNIQGVINQYSQGSGSGLIFDCDFGRLTYSDNAGIGNGTNLSAALAHSTTDWVSSSSNTPMTVNGGSFNYRVGRGGYLDCVQNEGRVSVAAGSGSPRISELLNTASMTIESWIWYDGAGREVIVSRYGSGFPNQFNMLCDPDGQFHYNNGGVGAGSGNITGQNFPDKTWHHHVWQYDSGNNVNRWYINGAFASSASAGSSLAVNDASGFAIASRADDYERWDGKIAVVRIYNRALSAAEIKNHFELDRGRFGV